MQGESISGEYSLHRKFQLKLDFIPVLSIRANKTNALFIGAHIVPSKRSRLYQANGKSLRSNHHLAQVASVSGTCHF